MEREPEGPYVYQPYGPASHPERVETKRFYGVAGLDQAEIRGLTKEEAVAVVEMLREG